MIPTSPTWFHRDHVPLPLPRISHFPPLPKNSFLAPTKSHNTSHFLPSSLRRPEDHIPRLVRNQWKLLMWENQERSSSFGDSRMIERWPHARQNLKCSMISVSCFRATNVARLFLPSIKTLSMILCTSLTEKALSETNGIEPSSLCCPKMVEVLVEKGWYVRLCDERMLGVCVFFFGHTSTHVMC